MKVKKRILFFVVVLILAMLACNLPGTNSRTAEPAAVPTISPTETVATVVVENTATSMPTETPIPPTETPSVPAEITLTKNSNCRMGPSTFYNIVDQISEQKVMQVIGRNDDSTWWQVVNATGRECWIFNENADENTDFSNVQIKEPLPLPNPPGQFFITNQSCQPGIKKFIVTMKWTSGGSDEVGFRIYRDGEKIVELKSNKFIHQDNFAPLNKNLTYEIEAVNENGASQRVAQIVPACR
ncbi:MAG: SH3 domain-containing protein [Anaerolineales bacterium]|nr:SH3 domain-containing protein [Anaerolineales bacterium]